MTSFLTWLAQTWVGRQIQKWLIKKAAELLYELSRTGWVEIKKLWRKYVQRKSVSELEEAFSKPSNTADERGKAYEKFNNTGR